MIGDITTAQVATVINACIAFVQVTFGLASVIVLVYAMRNVNPAISWSSITRTIHSSLWPTILQTDSVASGNATVVRAVSVLTLVGSILLAVAGVVTPLGLKDGPIVVSKYTQVAATYVPDSTPIGLATSPRDGYTYGRICGAVGLTPCPGNGNNGITSTIAPSTLATFSSTPHGPFNMQFRRFRPGPAGLNDSTSNGEFSVLQSFILRNDTFAIEGLIVDLTNNPGVGLWNHTFPSLKAGGTWDEDILWFEPITSCINTNITLDYKLSDGLAVPAFSLTDRGGIVNLTHEYPEYSPDGQHIDLYAHAYKGAMLSTASLVQSLGIRRNDSYVGRTFTFDNTTYPSLKAAQITYSFLSNVTVDDYTQSQILCQGYGGGDNANITNVGVHCFMLLAPAVRTDGGNPAVSEPDLTWTQSIHYCASSTRARVQTTTFSFNGTRDLRDLQITRKDSDKKVLWAMEKTDFKITDINPFWGRVDDSYENDSALWTVRSNTFYIPAAASDTWGVMAAGQPASVIGAAWSTLSAADASLELNTDYRVWGNMTYYLMTKIKWFL